MKDKQILDPCCGSRMFYFDKQNPNVLFADIRKFDGVRSGRHIVVNPDVVSDFRDLPFEDESFNLVIFDPPHLVNVGETSWMFAKYGRLDSDWKEDLKKGFSECWRVLRSGGTMIFKWSEVDVKLSEMRAIFPAEPLIGHRSGKAMGTHWITFYKEELA